MAAEKPIKPSLQLGWWGTLDHPLQYRHNSTHGQVPTAAQLASLHALLTWLCYHRPEMPAGRADVFGHGELVQYGNETHCPGSF